MIISELWWEAAKSHHLQKSRGGAMMSELFVLPPGDSSCDRLATGIDLEMSTNKKKEEEEEEEEAKRGRNVSGGLGRSIELRQQDSRDPTNLAFR